MQHPKLQHSYLGVNLCLHKACEASPLQATYRSGCLQPQTYIEGCAGPKAPQASPAIQFQGRSPVCYGVWGEAPVVQNNILVCEANNSFKRKICEANRLLFMGAQHPYIQIESQICAANRVLLSRIFASICEANTCVWLRSSPFCEAKVVQIIFTNICEANIVS